VITLANVNEAGKRGEWYTVKGTDSKGRPQSVDVPANYVDGKKESDVKKLFERSLDRVGNASEQR